jgi:hypothetical protein
MFKRGIESRMAASKIVQAASIKSSLESDIPAASKLFQRHQITELAAIFRRSPDPE